MKDAVLEKREIEIEVDSKKYTLTERALGDLSEFKSHIRKRRMRDLIDSLDGIEETERYKIIANSQRYTLSDVDMQAELVTAEGMMFMTWRALLPKHPETTHDDVIDMFMVEPDKMISSYYALIGITIAEEEDEDKGKDGKGDDPRKNVKGATD